MSSSVGPKSLVGIIESFYAGGSTDTWLRQALQDMRAVLDFGWGVGFALLREHGATRSIAMVDAVGAMEGVYEPLQTAGVALSYEAYKTIYRPLQSIVRAGSVKMPDEQRTVLGQAMHRVGANDALWMIGFPAPGHVFQLGAGLMTTRSLSLRERDTLHRVRIHLDAALRLRLNADAEPRAIFSADGRVLHCDAGIAAEASADMSHAARTIDRARARKGGRDHEALAQWKALVQGRWSLVERVDTDGRRHYLAFENAPHVRRYRALSTTELRVVEMMARGLSGKYVAYELGTSPSSVSETLQRAMFKLGTLQKNDTLRLVRGLLQSDPTVSIPQDALTHAETAVLTLLREGLSNLTIAELRGTSVRTVANQVASILRKTGSASRDQIFVEDVEPSHNARDGT